MILGDAENISEKELNTIYITQMHIDKRKVKPQSFHTIVDFDQYMDQYSSAESFRSRCLEAGYRLKSLIPVYHQGWEMDEWAANATKDGKNYFITTNHGSLVVEEEETFLQQFKKFVGWKR